jgi:adenine-specific DNA-methyltransferase
MFVPVPPVAASTDTSALPMQAVVELVECVLARAEGVGVEDRRNALLVVLDELRIPASARAAWSDGVDVLGTAYERLLDGGARRDAGQFQSPFYAADLMADWLLREPTQILLDPGVGSGRLLFRAGIRANAPARLLGFDTDALACAMARKNLNLRGLTKRSEVHQTDFLLDEVRERPDALTCNPPYSRHHVIAADAKAAIHDGFEQRLGLRLSRLAALHALFLLRALEVVAPGGRLAFITPSDWLDVGYGRKVKSWVLEHADIEGLVLFPEGHLPFGADVMASAAITLLRKHNNPESARKSAPNATCVVQLPEELTPVEDVLAALAGERRPSLRVVETRLAADHKWGRIPAGPTRRKRKGEKQLCELARVRRGIATGANSFFVVSEESRKELGLPESELRACITTPRLVEDLELAVDTLTTLSDATPRWALNCRRPDAETEDTPLGAYLRQGRAEGIPNGYLASRRRPWYGLEQRGPCPILFTYFNRGEARFIRNHAGAVPLNTWLIIEPKDGVDTDELWVALNAGVMRERLWAACRNYAGMWKLEPKELGAIGVPRLQRSATPRRPTPPPGPSS